MSENAEEKQGNRVITPVFRLSFPHFITPQPSMTAGGKAKFGNMAVFTPGEFDAEDKKRWQQMMVKLNDASLKKFQLPYKDLTPNIKKPFHRGDEKKQYGFTKDMIFINITSAVRPGFVKKDGKTKVLLEADIEAIFYPGCYCRASVNAFAYPTKSTSNANVVTPGLAFGVNNIMFVKHGERLDNRVEADEEFAELGEEEDLSTLDDLGLGDLGIEMPL